MRLIYILFAFNIFCLNAQIVNIPDVNFKNSLVNSLCADFDGDGSLDGDADTDDDGEIQVSEAQAVLGLHIEYKNIASMQGIEAFINILRLRCGGNLFQELDLSQNTKLLSLNCWDGQITDLTIVSDDIISISCDNNEISNIDITQCPNLERLYIMDNNLTSIDISNNSKLFSLWIFNNELENLDLSNNIDLSYLEAKNNSLINLDLSNNTSLAHLECQNNILETLIVNNGNNENLNTLVAQFNPNLFCIVIDDENANRPACTSSDSGWCIDPWTDFSESCGLLGVSNSNKINVRVAPNPVKDFITIQADVNIEEINIYSYNGSHIKKMTKNLSKIEVSELNRGLYFLVTSISNQEYVTKFIKI